MSLWFQFTISTRQTSVFALKLITLFIEEENVFANKVNIKKLRKKMKYFQMKIMHQIIIMKFIYNSNLGLEINIKIKKYKERNIECLKLLLLFFISIWLAEKY